MDVAIRKEAELIWIFMFFSYKKWESNLRFLPGFALENSRFNTQIEQSSQTHRFTGGTDVKRTSKINLIVPFFIFISYLFAQGVTTSSISGVVNDQTGQPLIGGNITATHTPSGTVYGTTTGEAGFFTIPNMRVGGPYTVKVSYIGFGDYEESGIYLVLGSSYRVNAVLQEKALEMAAVEVTVDQDEVFNSDRTGAETQISGNLVGSLPSIRRSTRDLIRLDPRNDGNYSFGGRNWLYNNISLDGSYFNNSFGLDDPAPGGQAGAEPVPFDAIEQIQVSIAPFDVREGGFTGAGINMVTKSGSNKLGGSVYSYSRNEKLQGNTIGGDDIVANPELSFVQSGVTLSGPIIEDKLFFFANAEMERRTDPGTNFTADKDGTIAVGESRVEASVMEDIRQRMIEVYDYDPGRYDGYYHETNNNKLLLKLDWNLSDQHRASFRYSMLDAVRDLPPHGFVLSFNNTGRGPNKSSLPFENSGYAINNNLHSFAAEVNSIFGGKAANRFFFSYNRFRDFRQPFSEDFPTIEIGENNVTYTTVGHEPFSIHNILDQDVTQITNNFNYFMGRHTLTAGINYEHFKFFNSFNIFRHGLFMVPGDLDLLYPGAGYLDFLGATTYSSLDNFFTRTGADPDSADYVDFRSMIGSGSYKGELIEVGQIAFYAQDEYQVNEDLRVTAGLRVDIPRYITEPVQNPFSTSLDLLDENDEKEVVDQAKLPDATPLYSPRFGFNWNVKGDKTLQLRGGSGVFTGRLPFVWIGNVISNPGANPNITGDGSNGQQTDDGKGRTEDEGVPSVLQQSFDLNAMADDFKWPQVWTTNLALDLTLPMQSVGTFEVVYSKDINAIYMRNADLPVEDHLLADGRPYYTDSEGNFELNPDGGAGVYVIDNVNKGYNLTLTAQVRKSFSHNFNTSLAYTYLDAKNNLKSTEIASVLWQSQPVQGDPNKPMLSASEFGNRHRIVGMANYRHDWNKSHSTNFGVFFEMAEGNRYVYSGGNRYSFIYSGDVNGDGYGGNDLIYIPENEGDINLVDVLGADGVTVLYSASDQWNDLDAFIEQDPYLSKNRGKISERHGLVNPWFNNIDLKILHDFNTSLGHFQFNVDIMNVANLINDNWGVRKVANPLALSPLAFDGTWANEEKTIPNLTFNGVENTFIDAPGEYSVWRIQLGLKYMF